MMRSLPHPTLNGGGVNRPVSEWRSSELPPPRLPCSSDLNSGNKNNTPGFTSNDNKRPGTDYAQASNFADHIKGSALFNCPHDYPNSSSLWRRRRGRSAMSLHAAHIPTLCILTLASCTHITIKQPHFPPSPPQRGRRHRTEPIRQTKLIVPSPRKAGTEQSFPCQAYASLNPHGSSYAMLPSAL